MPFLRPLHIENEEWHYHVGRRGVDIRPPKGSPLKKVYVDKATILESPDLRQHPESHVAVTPRHLRFYIDITYRGVPRAEAEARERAAYVRESNRLWQHCPRNEEHPLLRDPENGGTYRPHCSCWGARMGENDYLPCCLCNMPGQRPTP
jgi:hypothetical protein